MLQSVVCRTGYADVLVLVRYRAPTVGTVGRRASTHALAHEGHGTTRVETKMQILMSGYLFQVSSVIDKQQRWRQTWSA